MSIILLWVALTSNCKSLIAQSDFYAVENIPEIRLYFSQPNWDEILDSLYIQGELARLGADVLIDGKFYEDVGVRYKGFSSYSSSRDKNPFNIDLDYIHEDQNHEGFKKLKLSNVIQDPSFVREVLSYEIARKYMPASRANFANVYVNDTLIGLYTNVEAVDKTFLESHFGTNDNTFIKCNPETLDLNGENANLSNTPGNDIADYTHLYKLRSDDESGWYDLKEFIDTLNDAPENIESLLNVDRTLWMHAFNYAVINFDSYVGYAQNYYIYQDDYGLFNPILWDLNMSFASYRLTDASDHWDGFTIAQAKTIDPLQHVNSFSVHPRPLIRNLLTGDTQKRMYLAHLRTIIEENFSNLDYANRASYFQGLIDQSVQNDTNKFYSYDDFIDNLDSTVSDLVDYPGITELMNGRTAYLSTYPGIYGAPTVSGIDSYPAEKTAGESAWITADISGTPLNVLLMYRYSEGEPFSMVTMMDDGMQNDGGVGDGTFGARIDNIGNTVQYYIYAENDTVGRFSPERAAYEFYELNARLAPNDLVINEIMADNQFYITDDQGEYEDWVELVNNSSYDVSTNGMYLSDDSSNLAKWALPEVTILSGEHIAFWLDADTLQGDDHASFELDQSGGELWISYSDGTVLDSVIFPKQETVTSYGRYPNGWGDFVEMLPSFETTNNEGTAALLTDDVYIYPNPANQEVNIRINNSLESEVSMYSMDGRLALTPQTVEGKSTLKVNTSLYSTGIYLLHVQQGNENCVKKIIIKH